MSEEQYKRQLKESEAQREALARQLKEAKQRQVRLGAGGGLQRVRGCRGPDWRGVAKRVVGEETVAQAAGDRGRGDEGHNRAGVMTDTTMVS